MTETKLKCECPARKALETIHRHTDECIRYAASTGQPFCIGTCLDSLRAALSAPCPCEELRDELTEAREYSLEAMSSLKMIYESAQELSTILREQWKVPPNIDDTTIYCAALLTGFASAWKKNPPKNGFVHAVKFADLGTLEIEIRRINGKSAAESLSELKAERDQLLAALVRKIHDYSELWQEGNELRAQVKTLLNEIERITNDH